MRHFVELDDSFRDNLPSLTNDTKGQIAGIIHALEENAFFEPGDDYLFQRDPGDQSCVCSHIRDAWGDWKLIWYYEYSSLMPSMVEGVIVELAREAIELNVIKPRSSYQSILGNVAKDTPALETP